MTAGIQAARIGDVVELERLRNEAAAWLVGRGIEQWAVGEVPAGVLQAQVEAGEWHVVRDRDRVIGCLRLLWTDTDVWGEVPPVAGYVHGLVADRAHGRGLGRTLLDWAGTQVRRRGRDLLRLDCQEHNTALRAYYHRLGFVEVGRTSFGPDRPWRPVIRMERDLRPR